MKTLLSVLTCVIHYSAAYAQYNESIRADIPGQALSAFTVGKNIFQVQAGYNRFGASDKDNGANSSGYFINTGLRYGLSEKFEINYQFNYQAESETLDNTKTNQQGVNAMDAGVRYHIIKERGVIPSIALQLAARIPPLANDYKINYVAPRFYIITSQRLIQKIVLNTVWGASWNGNNSSPQGHYVINLSFPFNSRLGGFVENYGSIESGVYNSKFDGGISWLATNDLQLSLFGGYGYNQGVSSYFISPGVSWRTHRKKI